MQSSGMDVRRRSKPTLGVRLPNSGPFARADAVLSTAQRAEALGYERVWVHDHISWPREQLTHFATGSIEACADQDPNFFESVSTSAFLLGSFSRVGVGIAGLVLPLRDPRVLAKQLATLDQLGASRVVAAVGSGAIRGDFEVMGIPFNRRGRITTDYLRAMRAALSQDQPTSFASDTVSWNDGSFYPIADGLRLWATGSSDAGLARAASYCDGWLTVYQSVEQYGALVTRLEEVASKSGRDPESLDRGYETYVSVAEQHETAVAGARRSLEERLSSLERGLDVGIVGTPDAALEKVAAYGDAGATHIELKFIGHDLPQIWHQMEILADAAGILPAAARSAH